MKISLLTLSICGLLTYGFAAPLDDSANARILKYDFKNTGIDGYDFSFETSDGIERKESAELKDIGTDTKALTVDGFSTWIAPDGVKYTVNYIANEKGYQPWGAHLPNHERPT
ncbi:flexible cuticle protein 12-like [Ceratitis capitata]|uniref:flexible cuticle protein 12-like n=1 Tax=Ceratitis capitata TaxID=7213 RepID=UPI000329903E|nr:flexible cuticle protein 12-like [Ceratitis capitata]